MPIFEFKCLNCGHIFDKISKVEDRVSECPKCSKKAQKILSTFNAVGTSPFSKCSSAESCPSVGKSCCSSGTCSRHRG
ncbi:MAG TPA: zinc ribbon domain-containing protein [Victivallales bacterium]|nr:zinc ribbon domain-containing protein [Victivallales bacterium]